MTTFSERDIKKLSNHFRACKERLKETNIVKKKKKKSR